MRFFFLFPSSKDLAISTKYPEPPQRQPPTATTASPPKPSDIQTAELPPPHHAARSPPLRPHPFPKATTITITITCFSCSPTITPPKTSGPQTPTNHHQQRPTTQPKKKSPSAPHRTWKELLQAAQRPALRTPHFAPAPRIYRESAAFASAAHIPASLRRSVPRDAARATAQPAQPAQPWPWPQQQRRLERWVEQGRAGYCRRAPRVGVCGGGWAERAKRANG